MKLRIAFDLDETLGVPLVDGVSITGFRVREGGLELLQQLKLEHCLILWSVADRSYVNQTLSFGLAEYFTAIYAWDEIATRWKDIRRVRADYLIDDSPHHRESAREHGPERGYIVVPAYGSLEDRRDPLLRVWQIKAGLLHC